MTAGFSRSVAEDDLGLPTVAAWSLARAGAFSAEGFDDLFPSGALVPAGDTRGRGFKGVTGSSSASAGGGTSLGMTGSTFNAAAGVAMEVFGEQNVIFEMRILGELGMAFQRRTFAIRAGAK